MREGFVSCTSAAGPDVTASVGAAIMIFFSVSAGFSDFSEWIFDKIDLVSFSKAWEQRITTAARTPATSIKFFGMDLFAFKGHKGKN